ncbi:hypothetical protein VM1G_01012 [Cytospora mali]|uniref:DUF4211 domain-containing protein n=1 Tax=Cytospora mali TaxID=578113 RepID=A0A194VNB5_CYTMA|nr:hypothetical protein VM1G_01012 [Valsa mali]
MTSQKRGKQQQQRLAFETVPTSISPGQEGPSPAKVRFQSPKEASPNSLTVHPLKMVRPKKPRQQTLESSLAKAKTNRGSKQRSFVGDEDAEMLPVSIGNDVQVRRRQAPSSPLSSFMSKSRKAPRRVVDSESETPVEEDLSIDDTDGEGPPRHEVSRRKLSRPSKKQQPSDSSDVGMDDSDGKEDDVRSSQSLPNLTTLGDDSDNEPLVTPRSSVRRKKFQRVVKDKEEEEDDDDDDDVVQTPAKRRKLGGKARQVVSVTISDESDSSPGIPLGQTTPENRASAGPESSARKTRSSARKGHRSEKEKRMELLRRRRAGEKSLTMSDLETSEDEEDGDRGALYDTDSDHQALDHFEDESEPEQEPEPEESAKASKKKGRLLKKRTAGDEDEDEDAENSDGNLAGLIDDEDDTIGVPEEALYHMPLQFTRASRKPLKAHFKDAVEWLIHRRINPAFERDDEVYKTAWTRLNDEVMGLANSKFISAVWRPEFYRVLRARPYFETVELGAGHLVTETEKCQACGRSNHPATWAISFQGKPYDNWTLNEIEMESDSDSDSDGVDYDVDGNSLPPEDKQFFVGANCNSNAETAHSLLHWKPALRDWVDDFLERGGWLAPRKLAERERMTAKKRRKLADEIVEDCDQRDIIKRLFADFKHNIEIAQTKDTSRTSRGGRSYVR